MARFYLRAAFTVSGFENEFKRVACFDNQHELKLFEKWGTRSTALRDKRGQRTIAYILQTPNNILLTTTNPVGIGLPRNLAAKVKWIGPWLNVVVVVGALAPYTKRMGV